MPVSMRQLNRAMLQRQLLLERQHVSVTEAVHRIVALQAQEPASPYIALWNRIADFDPVELDAAFASGAVVKAHLMRITMHAVAAREYPPFHEAMQRTLRAARLNDRRFRSNGVTAAEADALIPELLAFASEPRSNSEMEAWAERHYGVPKPRVWWAIRHYGPFNHATGKGPWSFGPRPRYIAARDLARPGDDVASLGHLFLRYLSGFGPGSVADMASFALVNRPYAREAVERLLAGERVVPVDGPGTDPLFDVARGVIPAEELPAPPRLLPMWDSTLLAQADRGRIIPQAVRKQVTRSNGDVLPTLLVDGFVAGVWRATDLGIEATAFQPLDEDAWQGLDVEARSLLDLVGPREPRVYSRYARWWKALPAVEVRVLGR